MFLLRIQMEDIFWEGDGVIEFSNYESKFKIKKISFFFLGGGEVAVWGGGGGGLAEQGWG